MNKYNDLVKFGFSCYKLESYETSCLNLLYDDKIILELKYN